MLYCCFSHVSKWFLNITDMTVDKLQEFIPRVLSNLYIEAFMYGNVTKKVRQNIYEKQKI